MMLSINDITKQHSVECRILFIVTLNVIIMSLIMMYVIMMNVIMLSVMAPGAYYSVKVGSGLMGKY